MTRWRILVHALDRTGPPVLARSLVGWARRERPEVDVDVVAVRGGDLLADLVALVPVRVALDPNEPWDHRRPDPARAAEVHRRLADLPPADLTLLVSVSAAPVLPFLPAGGPVVAWVVEQGEDLHWLDDRSGLLDGIDAWVAGSDGTAAELSSRLAGAPVVPVAPEFVSVVEPAPEHASRCRRALGASADDLLFVAAGIATPRKAPDLFVEVALAWRRAGAPAARFVWIGGEHDRWYDPVRRQAADLGLDEVRFMSSVPDVAPWFAAADALVHPARLDAFPLVCLTAAQVGTPVVGFAGAGGLEEMFGASFLGAPFPDVVGLARRLTSLVDPEVRAAAGAAQRAATARFGVDVAAPLVVEAVERAAGVMA